MRPAAQSGPFSRVAPPTTTIENTSSATMKSHARTARSPSAATRDAGGDAAETAKAETLEVAFASVIRRARRAINAPNGRGGWEGP